jgi:phosphatidate cytidylyltransferase
VPPCRRDVHRPRAVLITVTVCGFLLGGILLALGERRAEAHDRSQRELKYVVYVAIVGVVFGAAALGIVWLQALVLLICIFGARELSSALEAPSARNLKLGVWSVYWVVAVLALVALHFLRPQAAAYLYLVVAVFDGFSQVCGQLVGRRPLVPRLSPRKTVEGLLGGLAAALLVAVLARSLAQRSLLAALTIGVLICAVALIGDLAASWLKRRAGIKDYGTLLPGHGGVLDRFDSFLPALALCGALLR